MTMVSHKTIDAITAMLNWVKKTKSYEKTRVAVVKGYPGVGKTKTMIELAKSYPAIWIFALPRRTLRDAVFERAKPSHAKKILGVPEVVQYRKLRVAKLLMKDELDDCPLHEHIKNLRQIVLQRFDLPLSRDIVARLPSTCLVWIYCMHICRKRREGQCPFLRELWTCIRLAAKSEHIMFVTTYVGAAILSMLLKEAVNSLVVVIDEFDDLATAMESYSIHETTVRAMVASGDEILERIGEKIASTWIYDHERRIYIAPILPFHAHAVIALSATPIEVVLTANPSVEIFTRTEIPIDKPVKDMLLYTPLWRSSTAAEKEISVVVNIIRDIMSITSKAGLSHGIVVPNKRVAQAVVEELWKHNIYAYYGDDIKRAYRSRNVIIVPNDRLYRGVSINKDVVIALYQGWDWDTIKFNLHPQLKKALGWRDPLIKRSMYMINMASNVQALFRFIRIHTMPHLVIILDKRMMDALRFFMKDYVENHCIVRDYPHPADFLTHLEHNILEFINYRLRYLSQQP